MGLAADKGQRVILIGAFELERGVNIAEAFSNSPPYWMTKSGSVTGAADGGNNLKEEYYEEFADYLTEVIKFYSEKIFCVFSHIEPIKQAYFSLVAKRKYTGRGLF